MSRYRNRKNPRSFLRKLVDYLSTGLFFALIVVAVTFFANLTSKDISGSFEVVDGDTLLSNGEKLRLEGIDAPEWLQKCQRTQSGSIKDWPCGKRSTGHLRELIAGKTVKCKSFGVDKYARPLVRCFAGGIDLNGNMVKTGWAVSYGDYYEQQAEAKANKVGIWQGKFELPQEWRRIHKGDVKNEAVLWSWVARFKSWIVSYF